MYSTLINFQMGQFEASICPTSFLVDVNGSGSLHLQPCATIQRNKNTVCNIPLTTSASCDTVQIEITYGHVQFYCCQSQTHQNGRRWFRSKKRYFDMLKRKEKPIQINVKVTCEKSNYKTLYLCWVFYKKCHRMSNMISPECVFSCADTSAHARTHVTQSGPM